MTTKIATFISISAFAFFASVAQAKVFDLSEGQRDFYDQNIPHLIDQAPYLFRCDIDSYADPARSSAKPLQDRSVPDIFAGGSSILDENLAAESCAVPVPGPDPFGNVARR